MATTISKPYVVSLDGERDYHATEAVGFRYHFDLQFKLSGAAFKNIIGTVSWNQEKKLLPGTVRTETTITSASFAVYQAGIGWAKIDEIGQNDEAEVTFSQRVIQFQKRFLLEVPVNPVLEAVPFLDKVDVTHNWVMEMHGVYDVISGYFKAELEFV